MKTTTTQLFSYKELSPEAKARVLQTIADRADIEPTQEEMLKSAKILAEACSLTVKNWNFDSYCRNPEFTVDNYHLEDMAGHKAIAWFAGILKNYGYTIMPHFKDMTFSGVCGFTGCCYDDDCAQAVWDSLMEGETVAEAFNSIAERLCGICEKELEYAQSEECILDYLDQDEEIYTEDGDEF